jgi:hypothetical protein
MVGFFRYMPEADDQLATLLTPTGQRLCIVAVERLDFPRLQPSAGRGLANPRSNPGSQPDCAVQSGLMFANLITLAHFSVSFAMSLPNSAGDPGITVPPNRQPDP